MASAVALPSTVETRTIWERQPAMLPRKDRNEPRHKMRLARKQFSLPTLLNQPAASGNLLAARGLKPNLTLLRVMPARDGFQQKPRAVYPVSVRQPGFDLRPFDR
jgi:hypothetical protein